MLVAGLAALFVTLLGVVALFLRDRGRLAAARTERDALRAQAARDAEEAQAREQRIADLDSGYREQRERAARLEEQLAGLRRQQEEERARLKEMKKEFEDAFGSLAHKALDASTKRFLELAKQQFQTHHEQSKAEHAKRAETVQHMVKPIQEALQKTHEHLGKIEKERGASYAGLTEQIKHIAAANEQLRTETGRLVQALRKPQVRGRYGEMQLERVAEIAGMRSYCDFSTQHTSRDSEGRALRPDMVVMLPNERIIAVDAKTNIEAYLDAIHAETPEDAERHLDRFARHVASQADALAKKQYWSQYDGSPEFVVMFVPGDQFVDAALERETDLIERAAQQGVIIASPSTLIGLLRAVYVGWREKSLSDAANELFKLGTELHDRAAVALGHAGDVGKAIEQAMQRYNRFVGSVDSRLMPTLRRFEEAGAKSAKELEDLKNVEGVRREMDIPPAAPDAPAENPGVEVRDHTRLFEEKRASADDPSDAESP